MAIGAVSRKSLQTGPKREIARLAVREPNKILIRREHWKMTDVLSDQNELFVNRGGTD